MVSEALRAARERTVRGHVEAERRGDWDATVRTFHRPRYEVTPTGEVHEGPEAVRRFLAETGAAFPDFDFTGMTLHHADGAVIVETTFVGTHLGPWRGLPPTGRRVTYKMCNVFVFEEDRLLCERLYFDLMTILRAVGIARDPASLAGRIATFANHPIAILRAFARRLPP